MRKNIWRRGALLAVAGLLAVVGASADTSAQKIGEELAARLTLPQQRAYVLHLRAWSQYELERDAYWKVVEDRRDGRKAKRAANRSFTAGDYQPTQPPKFAGPPMPDDVAKVIAQLRPPGKAPESTLPNLSDFLANARKYYKFSPETISEPEFKRRYAAEALRLGLSKDQVVRIYALETGGRGTFDMQAGIHPITRKGTPISTALGYAQLLAANSVNELVKHGPDFIARLTAQAAARGTSATRSRQLRAKAVAVRRMLRVARAVPKSWRAHVGLSRMPKGLGIHALNLDADIGPWLQAIKLRGVREEAVKAGRPNLSGAEIELMNLAGPRTGLEMMEPLGSNMPTSNFFSQRGYYRNTIVRYRTSIELLAALQDRMNVNLKHAGSVEFAKAFDLVLAEEGRRTARGR